MSAYVGSSKNLKDLNAFSADVSTEGRVVGLCWARLKPERPEGGEPAYNSSGNTLWRASHTANSCVETLIAVCVGLAEIPGPGSSAPQEQSSWGGNKVRARGGNGGRREGRGVRGVRTVGDVCEEELDDAIDLEIAKVRCTTYRTNFSEGSLCCWTPTECLRGTDRPWL